MRLIARLNVGGPARHVIWLTSRLPKRFERCLVTGHVEANEEEMTHLCAEEKVTPVYVSGLGRSIGPRDLAAFRRVLKLMRAYDPDIVHTHTAKAGMLGRGAAWLLNHTTRRSRPIRVIHTFHGHVLHSYFSAPVTAFFRLIERMLGHHATDRVVVITEQQRRELAETYRVAPPERFRVIPLGLDLSGFTPRAAAIAAGDTIRVGFVGRLTAIKDPLLFLAAGAQAIAAEPRVRLVVIGDGEMRGAMEAAAPPGTEFLGNRDDIASLMPTLDILVISSLNEGTPLSVIEAFAAAVPVATTAAGGCVDLLADGRGLVSPIGDGDALAANILRLIREPGLAEAQRQRAFAFVRRQYDLGRLLRDVELLYDDVMAE